jgi:hypothetical protein
MAAAVRRARFWARVRSAWGVAAGLVAGHGDGAEDAGPARQRHDQYRPEVQGGEQLQMVGILRNAANDVRGELLEQQRLAGVGSRVGGGEVDRAAVGQPARAAGSAGLLWARMWWRIVPSGASRRT